MEHTGRQETCFKTFNFPLNKYFCNVFVYYWTVLRDTNILTILIALCVEVAYKGNVCVLRAYQCRHAPTCGGSPTNQKHRSGLNLWGVSESNSVKLTRSTGYTETFLSHKLTFIRRRQPPPPPPCLSPPHMHWLRAPHLYLPSRCAAAAGLRRGSTEEKPWSSGRKRKCTWTLLSGRSLVDPPCVPPPAAPSHSPHIFPAPRVPGDRLLRHSTQWRHTPHGVNFFKYWFYHKVQIPHLLDCH